MLIKHQNHFSKAKHHLLSPVFKSAFYLLYVLLPHLGQLVHMSYRVAEMQNLGTWLGRWIRSHGRDNQANRSKQSGRRNAKYQWSPFSGDLTHSHGKLAASSKHPASVDLKDHPELKNLLLFDMTSVMLQSVAWKMKQDYQRLDLRRRALSLPSHWFFQGRGQAELALLFRSKLSCVAVFQDQEIPQRLWATKQKRDSLIKKVHGHLL